MIHKNYRKLCNLLVDVEEWGQVVIVNMLTRYARTQFINPNNTVSMEIVLFYVSAILFNHSYQTGKYWGRRGSDLRQASGFPRVHWFHQ